MFVAIDRTSRFVVGKLVPKADKMPAAQFLREVVEELRYRVRSVLTDNGIQFTNRRKDRYAMANPFGITCAEHGIEHPLTKVNHPWTNGQVERTNRTIKQAIGRRYHDGRHNQLSTHLADFVTACNYARRLKTLRGLTPYENVVKCWTEKPNRFKLDWCYHMLGPNTLIFPYGCTKSHAHTARILSQDEMRSPKPTEDQPG